MPSQIRSRMAVPWSWPSLSANTASAAAAVLLCATVSSAAAAQQANNSSVQVTPQTISVDSKTHLATVQFINTSAAHVEANIAVQYKSPADTAKSTATADPSAKDLTSWVKDIPKQIMLTPHETLTVKLRLEVPANVASGDYSAYIVATPNKKVASGADGSVGDGQPIRMSGQMSIGGQVVHMDQMMVSSKDDNGNAKLSSSNGDAAPAGTNKKAATKPFSAGKVVYHAGH